MSSTNKIEIVKRDSVIKIDVSAPAYYVIKNHVIKLIENTEDSNKLFENITSDDVELTDEELTIKLFLDVIAEIERTAKENNQTEIVDIEFKEEPDSNQDPS